jgi:hypothetical protein
VNLFVDLIADYAPRESKVERPALGRCIEYGAYKELRDAEDAAARRLAKTALPRKVHTNEGLDMALCSSALEAALLLAAPLQARPLKQRPRRKAGHPRPVCPRINQKKTYRAGCVYGGNFTFTHPVHRQGRKSGSLLSFHAKSGGTKSVKPRKSFPGPVRFFV